MFFPQMQSLREGLNLLKVEQAQKSKELLAKRETHHVNKFKELETTSNRKLEESSAKLEEAEAKIESLMKQLKDANKDCETKAEELDDMKDVLDKTNQDKRVLEEKLETLKTANSVQRFPNH